MLRRSLNVFRFVQMRFIENTSADKRVYYNQITDLVLARVTRNRVYSKPLLANISRGAKPAKYLSTIPLDINLADNISESSITPGIY